jgi:hypothetical protein
MSHGRLSLRSASTDEVILKGLSEGMMVGEACEAAGVSRSVAYRWRKHDPDFCRKWDEAVDIGTGLIEDELFRRTVHGVDEPVFYQGEIVGYTKRRSDALMMFLLRARRPQVYHERTTVEQHVTVSDMSVSEKAARIAQLMALASARRAETLPAPIEGDASVTDVQEISVVNGATDGF